MENILLGLAVLACPVGMGLMMWLMGRGMRQEPSAAHPEVDRGVEQLRQEHGRLAAEIHRREDEPVKPARLRRG